MQTFFLFEQLAPKKIWGRARGWTGTRGAHNKAEAVMPLIHPGQPLLAAIPPGKAGEDPGRRCDGTLGSSSNRQLHHVSRVLLFLGRLSGCPEASPNVGLRLVSVFRWLHCVCEHLFAGQTTMAPNEEGSRLVRQQGKARAVDDDELGMDGGRMALTAAADGWGFHPAAREETKQ